MTDGTLKFAELPDATKVLPAEMAKNVKQLLEDLRDLEAADEATSKALEETKAALELLQADQPGLRVGDLCFVSRMTAGRKTLDKVSLMENGVSKAQIDASHKIGKAYTTRTFKDLSKKGGDKHNAQTSAQAD